MNEIQCVEAELYSEKSSAVKEVAIMLAILVGVPLVAWLLFRFRLQTGLIEERSDAWAAVTAILTGLAFGGLIITLRHQRQELRLQRVELRLTRDEMAAATAAQRDSGDALEKRLELEKQFFRQRQTLDLHHSYMAAERGGTWRAAEQALSGIQKGTYEHARSKQDTYFVFGRHKYIADFSSSECPQLIDSLRQLVIFLHKISSLHRMGVLDDDLVTVLFLGEFTSRWGSLPSLLPDTLQIDPTMGRLLKELFFRMDALESYLSERIEDEDVRLELGIVEE